MQFFASEQFGFYDKLITDNYLGLLTLGNVVYPWLVWLFYANLELKSTSEGISVKSFVNGVKISLDRSVLTLIFGMKFIDNAPSNLTRKMAKDLCLTQFACLAKVEAYTRRRKAPPYHVLYPEPRLLHYVFIRICYPKDHSKEAYNEIALEAVYRLISGYSINYASVILHHLYHIANLNRNPSLPYGNLLTRIFTHFNVPLDGEECSTHLVPIISTNSLKTLRFYKTESRGW